MTLPGQEPTASVPETDPVIKTYSTLSPVEAADAA